MAKLSDLLTDSKESGVYLLERSVAVAEVKRLAKQHDLVCFVIDGKSVRGKDQFLMQAATALKFPDYFGYNWDAFADCLTDMEWHKRDGFVILYDNFDPLAANERNEFEVALEIFKESSEFWRGQGKLMIVLLSGNPENAKGLLQVSL